MFFQKTQKMFKKLSAKDNFQIMVQLKGDGNTGKSTIISVITKMLPENAVVTLSANFEKQFGLDGMNHRRLLVIPEMPANMSQILPQTIFQSMISGETVSVARKGKKAEQKEKWTTPMIAAGNNTTDYQDKSGSISRRIVVFAFINYILNRDTSLEKKIQEEIPVIAVRCIKKYLDFIARYGSSDIWDVVPQSLKDLRSEVQSETNALQDFLQNGDSYYEILYEKGSVVPLSTFKDAFKNHLRFHTDKRYKWTSDYFPFKNAHFEVKEINVCKSCGKIAHSQCCDNYHVTNRKKVTLIYNMRLKTKNEMSCPADIEEHL
jgi:hypothetical protein